MYAFGGLRQVRGDGDCWHRCVGFFLVELAIYQPQHWDHVLELFTRPSETLMHLVPSDIVRYRQQLDWLCSLRQQPNVNILDFEEALDSSYDRDWFLVTAIILLTIESIKASDEATQAAVCNDYDLTLNTGLDRLWKTMLYGGVRGRRYMATDHRQLIDIWGKLRMRCIIEIVGESDTIQLVETPRSATVIATIYLRLRSSHFDLLYCTDSSRDYGVIWEHSHDLDMAKCRLLGPWPDSVSTCAYLNTYDIDNALERIQHQCIEGVSLLETAFWDYARHQDHASCTRILERSSTDTTTLVTVCNIDNVHFVLLTIDLESSIIYQFDPLDYSNTDISVASVASGVLENFYSYSFGVVAQSGPRQRNMVDCGVHVFSVASSTIRGQPIPLEVNGLEARREIWSLLINPTAQDEESRVIRLRQNAQRLRIRRLEADVLWSEAGEDSDQARMGMLYRDSCEDIQLAAKSEDEEQRLDQIDISHQLVNLATLDYVEVGD
jgi:hypothetical protein